MNPFWAGIGAGAIVLMAAAALLILRQADWSLAEAVAGGLTLTLMALSLVFQTAFWAGRPTAARPVEVLLILTSAGFLTWRRRDLYAQIRQVLGFGHDHQLAFGAILASLMGLAALAVWSGPGVDAAISPLGRSSANHRVLVYLMGNGAPLGAAIVGGAGFGIIGAATYALARRYAWPPTAVTVTLVTISQPRLARLAAAQSTEIVAAAAGLFCLLALYRTVERHRLTDFVLLVVGLCFAICDAPLGRAFPLVLALLAAVVLYRRHGGRLWWRMVTGHPVVSATAAAVCLIFGGVWRLWGMPAAAANLDGPGYALNDDGIIGATANLLRYSLQSLDFGPALEDFCRRLLEISPADKIEAFYRLAVQPLFGQRGAATAFALSTGPDMAGVWFGPLSFCLVVPALLYALVRGPRRLKAVAVALCGYGYLATLIPAWTPGNASLFTRFFVCGGFMVAFLLPPWRLTHAGKIALQILCLLILADTLIEAYW